MKKIIVIVCGLLFAPLLLAADSTKIGVLDVKILLQKAPQAQTSGKKLENEFQKRKDTIVAKQKTLKTKHQKFSRNREILGEAERVKQERELTRLQQDLQRLDQEFRTDFTTRQHEEMDG